MQVFSNRTNEIPKPVVIGKFTVDVNFNVREVEVPKFGIPEKEMYEPDELEIAYEYTTHRYSLKEYTKIQAEKQAVLEQAIVELADTILGG